jgi:hydroxymethylpyrimidine pyrophosphatase-like HAD family hydrolase
VRKYSPIETLRGWLERDLASLPPRLQTRTSRHAATPLVGSPSGLRSDMRESPPIERSDWVVFLIGLVLILLGNTDALPGTSQRIVEGIGLAVMGYAPIRLIVAAPGLLRARRARRRLDGLFEPIVRVVATPGALPIFIATDVEGCLTPPHRSTVELRKFQQIRSYSDFARVNSAKGYPPLVMYTGRSQGYVELLVQALGLNDPNLDLPSVIENGCALYFPGRRQTVPLITDRQRETMTNVASVLRSSLAANEFEPKVYMVTLNPTAGQMVQDLYSRVFEALGRANLRAEVDINTTASAVDITPKGASKLTGLEKTVQEYRQMRPEQRATLTDVVALGDSTSDLPVLDAVGRAYCPAQEVHPEVRRRIETKYGADHVIDRHHIDFVLSVIERETGLRAM